MKRILALIMVFAASYSTAPAQDWRLKKEGKNLKVYTADVANSSCKAVRVECMVTGKASQVVAVMCDLERQKEWVFNDKYSYLLKRLADNEVIYYSEVSVPWPGTNRELISHMTITQPATGIVNIESHAEPDFLPEKDDLVRLRHSNFQWTISAAGNNQQKIVYEIQFDPGGSVPAWMINMFVTKGPYETFSKLQARMDLPYYRDAHFDFVKE
jgi:hypothetical protein